QVISATRSGRSWAAWADSNADRLSELCLRIRARILIENRLIKTVDTPYSTGVSALNLRARAG
ncbi:MAG TPA: hypothetical protein QF882_09525, partial [Arenicellales bacterium]|nr:hypothetical protein [Arenicellales bacterium]